MGTKFLPLFRCITSTRLVVFAVALFAMAIMTAPASAQDNVPFFCNGTNSTNGTCVMFQLDGSANTPASADTCVGTENGCPSEQNPVWPADWDALLYPGLASGTVNIIGSGAPPNAYSFSLPWGTFGSFSGIIPSTLVSTGTSTILKQGSKNGNDISTWVVALQASPPKDAYLAGAIASYVAPSVTASNTNPPVNPFYAGHEILYLGSTRFSPNGSATVGIWFFQQNVTICSTGPNAGKAMCVDGTSTPAQHQDKDLFLFLSFSGSGHATIQTATWSGNGTSGSLVPGSTLTSCPAGNSQACAVTNENNSITLGSSSGPQLPGFGFNVSGSGFPGFPGGVVPALQFQETGVDLNGVFNGVAPCFSSVMFASVTSGSSPSTASMKSILLGSFNTCAITVNKSCGTGTPNTSAGTVTYPISGTVENVGGGATTGLTLTDTFNSNPQSFDATPTCTCVGVSGCSITSNTCSTVNLSPGGMVSYSANITTSSNGGTDQIHAVMGGAGGGTASADSNVATCNSVTLSTGITISKSCTPGATLVPVGTPPVLEVQVAVGGTVTNNSSTGLTLSNVTVYDCVGGSFGMLSGNCPTVLPSTCSGTLRTVTTSLGDLTTSGATEPWSDTYFPSVPPACGTNDNFSDQVLVKATCSSSFCACPTVENVSSPANCPLCPNACPL